MLRPGMLHFNTMKNILLSVFVLLFSAVVSAASFQLHDVSILFPLPDKGELDLLWPPHLGGDKGQLLPASALAQLPALVEPLPPDQVLSSLRVVSLRIDPCFSSPCQRQVRLVWQPVRANGSRVVTLDAAVHTFYVLEEPEWGDFLRSYERIRMGGSPRPLGVHPRLESESLRGPFMKELTQLIRNFIGEKNLSRVTFMSLSGSANIWNFAGFDRVAEKFVPMSIPRLEGQGQSFINSAMPRLYFEAAQIVPEPKGTDVVERILRDSRHLGEADESAVVQDVQSLLKMENPLSHNAGTLDCVSCHVAQSARSYGEGRFPWRMHDFHHSANRYMNPNHDLRNLSSVKEITGNMRSFGYFVNQPSVSQRTINESAEVADQLSKTKGSMK